ncbi:MAG TPA: 2-hydroxyacyl-CoA dehydratase family protein [Deltaproteobacteria bacterium]|nr:2-hydroxyacyl-CoA dehydratase family protein [Deltaproteobacteria bacterium]HPR52785.1 2-hydroxyacyl-CoA dehydratase family protein [Deltaproteobacteria bacterium]
MMSSPLVKPFQENLSGYMERLEKLSGQGKKIIGYFCTYTPIELIHAAGFLPVRIMGGTGQIDTAYSLAPNFICPPLLLSLDKAMQGKYAFLSGVVQSYTCDVVCGLVNIWEENIGGEIYHSMALPYNDSPEGRRFYRASIQELITKLESIGGTITEASLRTSLELYTTIRNLILGLYSLRFQGRLPLSASDLHAVIQAGFVTPPQEYRTMLQHLLNQVRLDGTSIVEGVPLLISGSIIDDLLVMDIIEESGGCVVADDLCTGYRHFYPSCGRGDNALDCIIDRYSCRFPCPARTRAIERVPLLMDLAQRSGARGIAFIFQKFCTPHLSDFPILKEELGKAGMPNFHIELDAAGITEGQLRTRVQAFIEMLED